ncbi:MAG: polysaccharide export protein [Opitutae bacterium]|nr:polysaccharide export protein [Opitutae bacterium]
MKPFINTLSSQTSRIASFAVLFSSLISPSGLRAEDMEEKIPVFGASLFQGKFGNETFTGFNPNYQFSVGDQVRLQIWGAKEFNDILTVDTQGNLFIPGVGPLKVQGTRNADLIPALKRKVSEKFLNNVEVYATLEGAQPVKVFVRGNVLSPGLYSGHAADSVLFFLDKAGGIDPDRGTFLDIAIKRGGEVLQTVNLYDFLLKGELALTQFLDGDVIFVDRRKSTIIVEGAVHNSYQFEFAKDVIAGAKILEMAHPHSNATNVSIRTMKKGEIVSFYMPVADAAKRMLSDGDHLFFVPDAVPKTVEVLVKGEHEGPSRIVLPYPANLQSALEELQPSARSDKDSIQLFRKSISLRQREMLRESLDNLERKILTARSSSAQEAQIRTAEAELLLKFIERARKVQPKGQVVLSFWKNPGEIYLEDGDTLLIPAKSNLVMVHGEVLYPNAQLHDKKFGFQDYINRAGGYTANADKSNVLFFRRDGSIDNVRSSRSTFSRSRSVNAGDEIVVLPKADVKSLQLAKDISQIVYQIAIATRVAVDF